MDTMTRTVSPNRAKKSIVRAMQKKRPIFLWGPPGIGKSDIIAQITNSLPNSHLIDIRLSLWEPTAGESGHSGRAAQNGRRERPPRTGYRRVFHGELDTPTQAIVACQKIVDANIKSITEQETDPDKAYESYVCFGDDPWIEGVEFSAFEYAKIKIQAVLKGQNKYLLTVLRAREAVF